MVSRERRKGGKVLNQRNDKASAAAETIRDRLELAVHKSWDAEEGVAVGVLDVPVLVGDWVDPFAEVRLSACAVPLSCFATVVFASIGAGVLRARLARKTLNALNSCPRPVCPSYLLSVQRVPQVVPLGPPEHCWPAPRAELWM